MFTRVLQGHIGVSNLIFRQGISGCQIDALARMNLWKLGKDYNHGIVNIFLKYSTKFYNFV